MGNPTFYEAIDEGASFLTARRTITDADIINFAGVSGDFNPLHTDDLFIREATEFRGRIAHGLLALSVGSGLRSALDDWHTLAFLECRRRFEAPVYAGDTVRVEYRVASKRETRSRPGRGIIGLDVTMTNQDGTVVQSGQDILLVGKLSQDRA